MKVSPRPTAGFSLIELLTVITIIGILAAIIIPSMGGARDSAQRAVDSSNLSEIGKAAMLYSTANRDALPNPTQTSRTIGGTNQAYWQWFGQIARFGGLNDPTLFVSKLDDAIDPNALPLTVLDPDVTTPPTLHPDLTALPTLSWNVVAGLRAGDPPTTPIAFTRGLRTDGTWSGEGTADDDPNRGPYGDAGGFIVFLGGNVEFFASIEDRLVSNTGRPTSNLRQAVPNRSTVRILGMDSGNGVASPNGTSALQGP
ncbi:type II secretion system protein [Actomonas aquatica]|uniref:Prepilin-type N-terminal cleavage/methylation domain-containing protein n=1 Tax=Actomonas aquatica TaxID=2866162 RepID=A0ABZ1C9G9_9BACT|nr:prepilin-type N-terminal cleavage/methylation domain-containing protein [Opitutus sp. WL0086]WRQ88143.1 prepilin-type N-terminal cleavage/methylation domain-containing protein [Opitutus sp. WL0086]